MFDVLVHERPYKEAWTVEDAAGEIRTGSGTQFDPAVVAAFDALAAGSWTRRPSVQLRAASPQARPRSGRKHGMGRRRSPCCRRGHGAAGLRLRQHHRRCRCAPGGAGAAPGPAAVEPTDGRLGGATTVGSDGAVARALHRRPARRARARRRRAPRDGVGAGAACANPGLAPAAATLPAVAEATLCLLNGERADRGLAPLAPNAKLAAAATAYSQDLVDGSYFSHTGRDGSDVLDRIDRTGYIPRGAAWTLGENLAWGTGALATPGSMVQAWMNSPGHRENILNADYREIGIGIVTGNPAQADGAGATYSTTFGVIEGDEPAAAQRAQARKARKRARRAARARHARRARAASARAPTRVASRRARAGRGAGGRGAADVYCGSEGARSCSRAPNVAQYAV